MRKGPYISFSIGLDFTTSSHFSLLNTSISYGNHFLKKTIMGNWYSNSSRLVDTKVNILVVVKISKHINVGNHFMYFIDLKVHMFISPHSSDHTFIPLWTRFSI